ncbi:mambalgin-1 [Ictalurus punctatus]|uniref:Mambalgin-1 n=1 Tax=Ictalurus punctatus TaxID=7998 RepID=A0A2D0SDL5_ICTPU|nr:mambalgin-1 [Ictalurus punctatus]
MSKILVGFFTVALCFSLGYTLECYNCDLGLWSLCITSKVTCADNQHCYSGKGKAAGVFKVTMKGCLDVASCNKTSNINFPTNSSNVYEMTKTCCNTDLCNTAAPLALTHTLTLAIASLATMLLTKVLV